MYHQHHIQVNVSRQQFHDNIQRLREHVAPAKLCVVMKADAYGHGLDGLASTALQAGADMIGICTNPEAVSVRQVSVDAPLLRLRMALPEELDESIESLHIEEQVGTVEAAEYLNRAAKRRGHPVKVHLKVDTGMGRGGFDASELESMKRVIAMPGLNIAGVMTHLAQADAVELDYTREQLAVYEHLVEELSNELPEDVIYHTHNSAAAARLPCSRRHMVRSGAACYGVRTSQHFNNPPGLKPVMSVKTRIAQIRTIPAGVKIGYGGLYTTERLSQIASIPVGFGEGYPRSLFNKGIVLIGGQRCPVVGRVSLNVTTIDVTDLPTPPKWGDEVVLIGEQGNEHITFEEMADTFDSVHTVLNLMAGMMNDITYVD
jgi:alanine racemase